MFDLSYWSVFLTAAIVINVSPGPDLIYILSRTVAHGRRIGLASSLGVGTGALVHVVAAAIGISAILMASALAFTAVKMVGAAYLIFLGVQALRSAGKSLAVNPTPTRSINTWEAYRQGLLIDLLNPKVAIFFMAFLPQFIRSDAGPVSAQLILLGLMVIAIGLVFELLVVLLAARTTGFFRNSPKVGKWLDRVMGTILVALGFRLALSEHT